MDTNIQQRRPFTKVGYGLRPDTRIKSHIRHESSNFLMALRDAKFQVVRGKCGFKLEGQVVARCHRMEHAASGEVLFSVLSHAYTMFGSGFSHHWLEP